MILTSHIGSLPFKSILEAQSFNQDFDLPVLYTLPQLFQEDFMLAQVLGVNSAIEYSEPFFYKLVNSKLSIRHHDSIDFSREFKFQMLGPVTLIKSILNIPTLRVNELLSWYAKELVNLLEANKREKCYFFLDEPLLCSSESENILLNNFILKLKDHFLKIGLHCCQKLSFNSINFSILDGISFESKYLKILPAQVKIDLFIGILDTETLELDDTLDLSKLENKIYLTPHCGLAFSSCLMVRKVHEKLINWGKLAFLT